MLPWSLLLASATGSWGSSLYMAGLCRGHTCSDAKFPILDWAPHIKECVCNAHPCWNDQGVVHKCPGDRKEDKYLSFYYDNKGALHCGCSAEPHYGTIHLSKKVCPGHHCTPEYPILDFDEKKKQCFCRHHPCWDDNGVAHSCTDPKFPILRYREDTEASGKVKSVCESLAPMSAPHGEL